MKGKKRLFFILFLLCCVSAAHSQDNTGLSITVSPAFDLPAGSTSDYFSSGGGGGVFLDYVLPRSPFFTLKGRIGAKYLPFGESSAVSLLYLGAGPDLNFHIGSLFLLRPYGTAGIYAGTVTGGTDYSETNFALKAGTEVFFPMGERLGLSLNGSYHYFHSFYHGIGLSAGLTFFPGKKKEAPHPQQLLTPPRRLRRQPRDRGDPPPAGVSRFFYLLRYEPPRRRTGDQQRDRTAERSQDRSARRVLHDGTETMSPYRGARFR